MPETGPENSNPRGERTEPRSPKTILLVEDNPEFQEILRIKLQLSHYLVTVTSTGAGCLEYLATRIPDIILLDLKLPDATGSDVLQEIRRRLPEVPVIVMTAYGSERMAVDCIRNGAEDYLKKPIDLDELLVSVERGIERSQLQVENIKLKRALLRRDRFRNILGMSPVMQEIFNRIACILDTDANVFIQGETGTGKELIAEAIHYEGIRRRGPFIPINCAAIPDALFESELFGHVKGAFTGAFQRKTGKIALAHEGTLFLDEVSEMSPRLQAKLLRIIQDKEITPIGGNTSQRVDVRFIAATNQEIKASLASGAFRQDLYYRLAVISFTLPALRERAVDILLLAEEFLMKSCQRHGKGIRGFTGAAREALVRYGWPGNVRELENKIERAVLLTTGPMIDIENLELNPADQLAETAAAGVPLGGQLPKFHAAKAEFEKTYLLRLLEHTQGNISVSSQLSGIYRPDIYRMARKYGIDVTRFRD